MQKVCSNPWCHQPFDIADEDLVHYDQCSPIFGGIKFLIPPPSQCPDCRQQRRLAWRNERNLYSRDCALCGKHMISVHAPSAPYPVYCVNCWWSDRWDRLSFGRVYNPARPFLDQWVELRSVVPQLAIQNDNGIESENSEYCYDISRCKDCYRLIGSWYDRECHYGLNINESRNVVDCNTVSINSELVYESLDSQRCYHCTYLQNCENCHDCFFGFDLKGCSNCFCCYGLRQKTFCIFNEQHTEEDYRAKMESFHLGSFLSVQEAERQFDAWVLKFPRLYANIQHSEDCEGNNLFHCKSVLGYSVFNAEYCKYVDRSDKPVHSYDLINNGGAQWCTDCVTPDDSYQTHFSTWCWKSKNILLSDNCHSSEHLLGCISLHRAKYCILNKQYSKAEYEALAGTIIDALKEEGEWGEHLPVRLSPFGYNESAASEYYPLTKDDVVARGWHWSDQLPYTTGKETIAMETIADDIADVPDSIVQEVLACTACGKNYKLIPAELDFYRKMPCPIPRRCPDCRHLVRFAKKTPTRLWDRSCDKCGKEFRTTYQPSRPEQIFCLECYRKERFES
ncbi:MAG: hypothetical protein PHZ00_00045 [Candidatus Peribacteraceae bacterium]|nr:hypothetical protein [Candidatus Peribacteraceae bacterium]